MGKGASRRAGGRAGEKDDFLSILRGARLGMADTVAEQIAALKDEDWAIREEAATMLGALRDPRAVAPLVSILRDDDRAVRDAATAALLAIGEPAVTTLGACLSDPVLTVQELASSVLVTI